MLLRDDFTITYLLLIGTEVIDLLNTRSLSSTCWFTHLLNLTNMHGRCHKQPIIDLGIRMSENSFTIPTVESLSTTDPVTSITGKDRKANRKVVQNDTN